MLKYSIYGINYFIGYFLRFPVYFDNLPIHVKNHLLVSLSTFLSCAKQHFKNIKNIAVHDQLHQYLTKCNILNPCQSIFRSNHSTSSTLLDVSDHILQNINNGGAIAAIFSRP